MLSSAKKILLAKDIKKNFSEKYKRFHWRPFQLAFQLLVVESMLNEKSSNRDLVDLIWFPTGGGKTEAYLAVAAMEIFHRRLKYGAKGGGTVVLKRYTLRLLTSQQFQRAARLICACELIRQNDKNLGDEPITLGLWVGQGTTPNKFTTNNKAPGSLEAHNEQLKQDRPINPFALMACPWCNTSIYPEKHDDNSSVYGVEATETSFKFFCPDENCAFHRIIIKIISRYAQKFFFSNGYMGKRVKWNLVLSKKKLVKQIF